MHSRTFCYPQSLGDDGVHWKGTIDPELKSKLEVRFTSPGQVDLVVLTSGPSICLSLVLKSWHIAGIVVLS